MNDPKLGTIVSHYRILEKLGAGGMGVVYEAEDTKLGRKVALKFLSADLANDHASLERFQREARAASALNHPNICTVYSIEEADHERFIVMELLEGKTLAQLMGRHPLSIDQVLDFGIQIADALESAHARGILHRDIKPANIFVNDRGQVKVLDFGLAKFDRPRRGADGQAATQHDTDLVRTDLTVAGSALGTVAYMSPEQARGQAADARADLFSLGTVLYQMAAGVLPFPGDTEAVVFEAILNRDPTPPSQVNPAVPPQLERILEKALEKDRSLRCQSATELKTDLARLKRDLGSRKTRTVDSDSRSGAAGHAERSVAVLYFENLSGVKEDEYFRDGITEDIITELSKIKGLNTFSRATVLTYRGVSVTPALVGQQLGAGYVLTGSLRRAGDRIRITAQLIDTHTDFPLWSERYDREMKDIFEVQDEIARKIAEALRITLSPQEKAALADKPTEDLQAYDLYLRGKSYARRLTRQDLEFALQMFENAVARDPNFALAYAAIAKVCAEYYYNFQRDQIWVDRAMTASQRAVSLKPELPEVQIAQSWILYAKNDYEAAIRGAQAAIQRKSDCEGAYYLLGRALFAAGRHQEVAAMAEAALEASGEDYNVFVPIQNSLGALGKREAERNIRLRRVDTLEKHLKPVPEDARARVLLASDYANLGRGEDAIREANLAIALRPNEATVLYNAACVFTSLERLDEAMAALKKAWDAGFRESDWARRDPDLAPLLGRPDFERLYPERGKEPA